MKLRVIRRRGLGAIDVVGESNYQAQLRRLYDEWPYREGWAVLVPETGNPYGSESVRVDAIAPDGTLHTIGYLPSGHGLKPKLSALANKKGQICAVYAVLKGQETLGVDIRDQGLDKRVPAEVDAWTMYRASE